MRHFKEHSKFLSVMVVLAACLILDAVLIGLAVSELRHTANRIVADTASARILGTANPAPTGENLEALKDEKNKFSSAADELASALGNLGTLGVKASELEQESQDFYFELVAMIEGFRTRAAESGIQLDPSENFGFDDMVRSGHGPSEADLRSAVTQRKAIAYLVGRLLVSEPDELIAVQRERANGQRTRSARAVRGWSTGDRFEIDNRLTTGVSGEVDAEAFRLVFSGTTDSLRTFLKSLARSKEPILVRSVEVRPAEESGRDSESRQPRRESAAVASLFGEADGLADDGSIPIVRDNRSLFSVTVERFELADGDKPGPPRGADESYETIF